jgi:hypothetical protein
MKKLVLRAGGAAQTVKGLPHNCEGLSSNPRTAKKKPPQIIIDTSVIPSSSDPV